MPLERNVMGVFFVVGISHKTASIDIRERVFLRPAERELLLNALRNDPCYQEGMILSTCNRTEIYVSVVSGDFNPQRVIDLLFSVKKISVDDFIRKSFYCFTAENCLRHLLRVITGLDSIVLGEKQILGQVKEAIELSRSKGMMHKSFNIMSDCVIRAGKKAQRETDISCGGGSVSWAAVNAAQSMMKTLKDKSVLILGAGKMSLLTAEQLKNKQIQKLYIMNRSIEKAQSLASQLEGEAVMYMDLKEVLMKTDLCISSVSAPHYLINYDLVQKVINAREGEEIVFIDISTPRSVDPQIKQLNNVRLLTVDDLGQVLKENMERRKLAINHVEMIIQNKILEYYMKMSKPSNSISPVYS